MRKTRTFNGLWVSVDGSWGNGEIQLFDTKHWLDEDWEHLDEAADAEKLLVARYITRKRNKQAKKTAEIIAGARLLEVRTIILSGNENGLDKNA